ncbi:hypothetical protein G5V58_05955 [Nocardioides anomalus]|uniref:Uncharacterized protein n=1 Tax=Nocardioides anomalus TaxID=2712223 RepID=A0A6G6WAW9_9ACTN|nr:hypothetical protein [Nocardioides anomalus]QIG42374.1 hypothetical protein G5V58_05955 [Nocardioides anomalus]
MSTEEQAVEAPVEDDARAEGEPTDDAKPAPSWWHRDHPTFSALSGFFTGLLFVALVPAAFVGVLSVVFDTEEAEDLFPFVLLTLVVPLALIASKRTRRFGKYFLLGMVLTAVVVVGVGSLVLWYLVEHQQ